MYNENSLNNKSFEDLCDHIIRKEFEGISFFRIDGKGGDGGIEFYIEHTDGSIEGRQCKYFDGNGRRKDGNRSQQITNSIETAIKTYPTLCKYTLCIKNNRTPKEIKIFQERQKKYFTIDLSFCGASELHAFMIKYPEIDNYFFETDITKQREGFVKGINDDENTLIKATEIATKKQDDIDSVFINGNDNDIIWGKKKYVMYNTSKFRFIDCIPIMKDIENIEHSICIENLDLKQYSFFQKDFQGTVSNYFHTFKSKLPEWQPTFNNILYDVGQQIGGILNLGVNGQFQLKQIDSIYYLQTKEDE